MWNPGKMFFKETEMVKCDFIFWVRDNIEKSVEYTREQ